MNIDIEARASAKRARRALAQLNWALAGGDWWHKNLPKMMKFWQARIDRRKAVHA